MKGSFWNWLCGSWVRMWVVFILYPLVVGVMVQFFVLPVLFPSLHAGEGLLKGGDWIYFHRLALHLAERIRLQGWHAWELRPEGQAPAGIAAILYVIFVPKPWIFLPLNALLHGTSTLILALLIFSLTGKREQAFLSVLPFWLFPSAMIWYTQIHKDGFAILGSFLFLYGLIRFLKEKEKEAFGFSSFSPFVFLILGGFLIWVMRPYVLEILWFLSVLFALVVSGASFFSYREGLVTHRIWKIILLWATLTLLFPLTQGVGVAEGEVLDIKWYDTPGIPSFVEQKLMGLARVRLAYYRGYDPSLEGNIDWHIFFHSALDIIRYLPRALEIGLFAPFPLEWKKVGTSPAGYIIRKVAAGEMLLIYVMLFFFFLLLFRWKKFTSIWVLTYFSLSIILIYALSVPNVGSLYRARYGFLMLLSCLGISQIWELRRGNVLEGKNPGG